MQERTGTCVCETEILHSTPDPLTFFVSIFYKFLATLRSGHQARQPELPSE